MVKYIGNTPVTDDGLAVPVAIVPGADGGGGGGLPSAASATITTLQTAAIGANFTAFTNLSCTSLEILNNTGVTIEYRRGGGGAAFPILSGTSRLIIAITNANQISIRRVDQSNSQVTIAAEVFS